MPPRAKKKDDGGRQLGFGAVALQRHGGRVLADLRLGFGRVGVEAAGCDAARRHRVHAHARRGPLAGRRFAEREHAAARRARVRVVGPTVPDVGDDVDDRAAVRLHPAQVGLAHHDETAGQVVSHHSFEAFGRKGLHRRPVLPACVVHQAIDAAMLRQHGVDGSYDLGFIPDVADVRTAPAPVRLDFPSHGLELLRRAAPDGNRCTQRCELVRGAAANTAAAAGHDDDPAGKQAGAKHGLIGHVDPPLQYWTAARPMRSRAMMSFMMPAVPSPISRPITSRMRC